MSKLISQQNRSNRSSDSDKLDNRTSVWLPKKKIKPFLVLIDRMLDVSEGVIDLQRVIKVRANTILNAKNGKLSATVASKILKKYNEMKDKGLLNG
jgi:hypothetical protein